ncbi:MAG: hypothetical protein DRP45_03150 [Candidatus Zixiibacteriota bacterium]|nr:MAG: hypothetical protein DRP45_03150 [candidate division Zixibacteria bacterium]
MLSVPSALSVGCVYRLPGSSLYRHPIIPEGSDFDSRIGADQLWIDEGFVATLGVNITQGRTFAPDPPEDQAFEVMVNETLWQQLQRDLGWDSPIGRTLDFRDEPDGESDRAEIIGVVDDILWGSAKKVCLPMVIEYAQDWARFVLVKIPENNIDGALADLEAKFNEVFPGEAYRMEFLDESFGAQFQTEKQFGAEVGVFSSLAIIVACMGLLGLATFATQQRRREIAVRKVLGSGTARIVNMLLSDFMKLIAIGMVIAWPVAYYFMDNWLNNFAHKVTLDHWPFILSGVAVLVMALLTVSTQSWQAARTNPVDALRRES